MNIKKLGIFSIGFCAGLVVDELVNIYLERKEMAENKPIEEAEEKPNFVDDEMDA